MSTAIQMPLVLVVTRVNTHPTNAGHRVRIRTLLDTLRRLGLRVHLAYLCSNPASTDEAARIAAMRAHWGADNVSVLGSSRRPPPPVTKVFRRAAQALSKTLRAPVLWPALGLDEWRPGNGTAALRALVERLKPDAMQVEYVFDSWAFEAAPPGCLRVLDTHDMFSNRHRRFIAGGKLPEWFYTTPAEERRGLLRAEQVLAIQDTEREFFETLTARRAVTVGHLLDVAAETTPARMPVAGFFGADNTVNRDAMAWFTSEIWPEVKRLAPDARFEVYGGIGKQMKPAEGIELKGVVDDLDAAYRRVAVVVCPLRFGTGLKIKCIEALAKGKALVTTASGAEGLTATGRAHLEVADDAKAFAGAVAALLKDESRRAALECAALAFARGWQESQVAALRSVYAPLLARPLPKLRAGS